jgi:ribosome-associated protein
VSNSEAGQSSATTELAPGVFIAPLAIRLQFARSGGPGGQNVNKLNTKAQLWVRVDAIVGLTARAKSRLRDLAGNRLTQEDEIHLQSEEERSQESNRQAVFQRLREMIVQAKIEPKIRRRTKPSKSAKRKRMDTKRHRGQIKTHRRAENHEDW